MANRKWTPRIFAENGTPPRCPIYSFLQSETDVGVRAKVIAKINHLAKVGKAEARRPLVDTLDGPIKELIVDKQVRILFSWEPPDVLLILGGLRKKNGAVDPAAVAGAKDDLAIWRRRGSSAPIDQLEKALKV